MVKEEEGNNPQGVLYTKKVQLRILAQLNSPSHVGNSSVQVPFTIHMEEFVPVPFSI